MFNSEVGPDPSESFVSAKIAAGVLARHTTPQYAFNQSQPYAPRSNAYVASTIVAPEQAELDSGQTATQGRFGEVFPERKNRAKHASSTERTSLSAIGLVPQRDCIPSNLRTCMFADAARRRNAAVTRNAT